MNTNSPSGSASTLPDEYTYLSLQSNSFDDWDKHIFEASGGAQSITDLHFRIGDQEWKGSLRELMAAQQGAAQAQAGDDPVVEANRKLLLDRSRVGIAKYGVTLASADLSRGQLAQHALEEALDLANYLQAIIQSDRAAMAAPATSNGSKA